MLTLLYGADRLEVSREVLSRICGNAARGKSGNILIVPEQYSHETERELCRIGGDSISRYAEVLSFSRLSGRVASIYGGICEEYLDEGGRRLSLYLAAQQVLPQLKYYAAAAGKPSFLQQLGAAVEEFLSYCLSPQDIFRAAARAEGTFSQKLQELGLLYESYLSICKTGRNDPITRLYTLDTQLFEEDYATGKRFYLDGFSDFTAAQRKILQTLLPQADITIALPAGDRSLSIFATAAETMRQLTALAREANVPVERAFFPQAAQRNERISCWLGSVFGETAEIYTEISDEIAVCKANSCAEECAFAVEYVRRLVRQNGEYPLRQAAADERQNLRQDECGEVRQLRQAAADLRQAPRYRDITIAVTSGAAYLPLLHAALRRAGIPAYFAGTIPLVQSPAAAGVLAALRATERYDYEDVMTYLKSAISPVTAEDADYLEQYAYKWSLRGLLWEKQQDDARAEQTRAAVMRPLQTLRGGLRTAPGAGEQAEAVAAFLQEIGLQERLAAESARQSAAGNPQQAQQTEQVYEYLLQALEQIWQIAGRQPMTQETFIRIFELVLGCYQIGTIPANADEVQVAPLASIRHKQTKHLILLGVEEGKFPSFEAAAGLLSDEERKKLLGYGIHVAPAQETRLERELGWIYAALSAVTEEVVLGYSGQASYLVERTTALFPNCRKLRAEDYPYLPDAAAAASVFVRQGRQRLLEPHPALLTQAQMLTQKSRYAFTPLEDETVHGLYGRQIQLSASRIDQFAACKYAFFQRYGLKTQPWKQARFDAPLFGTFVHAILEQTVQETMRRGGFHAVSDEELRTIADRHIQAYAQSVLPELVADSERFRYLFARNRREVLEIVTDVGRELRKSQFVPVDTELSFARDGALPPVAVHAGRGEGQVTGFVDRVDLYETAGTAYYRVVDYKTGQKDFDYASILEGEGLQMLIYLFALRRYGAERYGKPVLPAGVLYVPSRAGMDRIEPGQTAEDVETMRRKKVRRKGLLLDDERVLQAMEDGERPEYLPVQRKKDGLAGDLASREQLALLDRFISGSLERLTDGILSGEVAPDPLVRGPMQSACQYCDYRTVCHQDLCTQARRYLAAVKPEQFWDEVERRVRNGGDADGGTAGGR